LLLNKKADSHLPLENSKKISSPEITEHVYKAFNPPRFTSSSGIATFGSGQISLRSSGSTLQRNKFISNMLTTP